MTEIRKNFAAVFWKGADDGAIDLRDGDSIKEWDLILDEADVGRSYLWPNTLCTTLDDVFNIEGLYNILIPDTATRNFKNALDYFSHVIEFVGTISQQHQLTLHIELSPTDEGLEEFLGARPNASWERICIHHDYFDAPYMDVKITEDSFALNVSCDAKGVKDAQNFYEKRMRPRREVMVPFPPPRPLPPPPPPLFGINGSISWRRKKLNIHRDEMKFEGNLKRADWFFERYTRCNQRTYIGPSATTAKVEKVVAARFGSDYKFGPVDRWSTNDFLLPNARYRWPYQRELILALQLAIDSVCCAPYVILEIYDWLPAAKHFTHKQKIEFIEGVRASIRRVQRLAASVSVADRVKRRSLTKRFAVGEKK